MVFLMFPGLGHLARQGLCMELVCSKFNETMPQELARCRHTADYCRYRTSCMIHFLEQDRLREGDAGVAAPADDCPSEGEDHDHAPL